MTAETTPLRPTDRPEPSRFTGHDGLSLVYDDLGTADGDPIVFLHGATDSRVTWDPVVAALADGYRVLLPDARSQGDSDRAPGGDDPLEPFVADVITLCEDVVERPAVFVGASHGGTIATALAAHRPDLARGLFLLDPPLFGAIPADVALVFDGLSGLLAAIDGRDDCDDRHLAMRELLSGAPSLSGDGTMTEVLGEDAVDRLAYSWSRVDPAFVELVQKAATEEEPFAIDTPIACPALVVCGDEGEWGTCFHPDHRDRLRALAPHAEFVTATGLGHMIHAARPGWVADQLSAFLSSL